jgi:hypothetical protein
MHLKLERELGHYSLLSEALSIARKRAEGNRDYARKLGLRASGKDKRQRESSIREQFDAVQRRLDDLFLVGAVAAFEDAFADKFDNAIGKGRAVLQDRMQHENLAFCKHGARLVRERGDADNFRKILGIVAGIASSDDTLELDGLRRCRNSIVHVEPDRERASTLTVEDSLRLLDRLLMAIDER